MAFTRQHGIELENLTVDRIEQGPLHARQDLQTCDDLTIWFSSGKTSGFALTATQLSLADRGWILHGEIRLSALPEGVSPDAKQSLLLAEAQAKRGNLPAGLRAPDITYSRLPGGGEEKLSELRGKVVVIGFWDSWDPTCGPPIARMQTYPGRFPHWAGRVALVTVNLDETVERAAGHLGKKGWNRSHNVWAGPGGFGAAAARAFAVGKLPTFFILDPEGVVVRSGHPGEINVPSEVEALLVP